MTYFYFRQSQYNGEKQCLTFSHGARSWEKVATQYRISFKELHTPCAHYVQGSSLSLSLYISHSRAGNQRGVACCDGNVRVPLEVYKKIKLCWAPAFLSGLLPPQLILLTKGQCAQSDFSEHCNEPQQNHPLQSLVSGSFLVDNVSVDMTL